MTEVTKLKPRSSQVLLIVPVESLVKQIVFMVTITKSVARVLLSPVHRVPFYSFPNSMASRRRISILANATEPLMVGRFSSRTEPKDEKDYSLLIIGTLIVRSLLP